MINRRSDHRTAMLMDRRIKHELLAPAAIALVVGAIVASGVWLWLKNGPTLLLQLIASSAAFLCL